MSSEITIRAATINDIDFIITCIIEAERAGTHASSYERIFTISENELRAVLRNILVEEISGCELYCDNYYLAFDGNVPVAGIAAWVEGSGTQASNSVRANLFSYFLGADKWMRSQKNLNLVSRYEIQRMSGSMQFEDGYVAQEYRGNRIIERIFAYAIKEYEIKYPSLKLAQGLTLIGNIQSMITMIKMKWKQSRSIIFDNEAIRDLLPGKGKIQWELKLNE